MSGDDQPFVVFWPMFEEVHSKFPVLADIAEARLKLARKFNRHLPKDVEIELAWREHVRRSRQGRGAVTTTMASVYDGREHVGYVLHHLDEHVFEAIDTENRSHGMFTTHREAAAALPGRSTTPVNDRVRL